MTLLIKPLAIFAAIQTGQMGGIPVVNRSRCDPACDAVTTIATQQIAAPYAAPYPLFSSLFSPQTTNAQCYGIGLFHNAAETQEGEQPLCDKETQVLEKEETQVLEKEETQVLEKAQGHDTSEEAQETESSDEIPRGASGGRFTTHRICAMVMFGSGVALVFKRREIEHEARQIKRKAERKVLLIKDLALLACGSTAIKAQRAFRGLRNVSIFGIRPGHNIYNNTRTILYPWLYFALPFKLTYWGPYAIYRLTIGTLTTLYSNSSSLLLLGGIFHLWYNSRPETQEQSAETARAQLAQAKAQTGLNATYRYRARQREDRPQTEAEAAAEAADQGELAALQANVNRAEAAAEAEAARAGRPQRGIMPTWLNRCITVGRWTHRGAAVLVPTSAMMMVGWVFLMAGLITLLAIKLLFDITVFCITLPWKCVKRFFGPSFFSSTKKTIDLASKTIDLASKTIEIKGG